MKVLSIILITFGLLLSSSCKKECTNSQTVTCQEVVPTEELCEMSVVSWFYDKSSNSCTQISYSGCSVKGFATQKECESCLCNN